MKICYVSIEVAGVRGGGIGTYIAEAGKALTAHGHEVWLLIDDPQMSDEDLKQTLPGFHRVVSVGHGVPPEEIIRIGNGYPHYDYAYRVHQTLQHLGEQFDYIEFADYQAEGYVCFKEQDQFGTYDPAILAVTLHSPTWECFAYDKQAHRCDLRIREVCSLEEEAIRIAPFINSPSEGLRDEALGRMGYADREVAIIRYPMELEAVSPEPPKPRQSLDQLEYLYYGRIEPRKGIDEIVAAFAMMPELKLTLIGGDVPYSPFGDSYRDYVKLSAPDNVEFLEPLPRPELLKRILKADVCIFPSLFENYPNTCIEAMSAARVVIGSEHGGMSEMIEHGVSGFHVDGRSPEDIVRVIREDLRTALPRLDEIGRAAAVRMRTLSEQKTYVDTLIARIEAAQNKRKIVPFARREERKVTIVIPFYKDRDTISATVDSAIGQTHKNLEILIVNDGSPLSDVEAILDEQCKKDPRIRALTKKNGGVGTARNHGIENAKGDYLLFLDADNLAQPEYAQIGVDILERKPESVFVAGHVHFFDGDTGESKGIYNPLPFNRKSALLLNRFGDAGAFFRRSMFIETGLRYDKVRTAYEDWGLWMDLDRLGLRGEVVPRMLYNYCVRSNSMMEEHGRANHSASMGWLIHHHFADLSPDEARDVLTTIFQVAGKSILGVMMGNPDQESNQAAAQQEQPSTQASDETTTEDCSDSATEAEADATEIEAGPTEAELDAAEATADATKIVIDATDVEPPTPAVTNSQPPKDWPLRYRVVDEMSRLSKKLPGLNRVLRLALGAGSKMGKRSTD